MRSWLIRFTLGRTDQFSGEVIGSWLASVASFNRSALLMYVDLRRGANLALAFFALAFSSCLIFF